MNFNLFTVRKKNQVFDMKASKTNAKVRLFSQILFTMLTLGLLLNACSNNDNKNNEANNRFNQLINYLESEGDYINSPEIPFFIGAHEVFEGMNSNFLIIDVRDTADYETNHIEGSVNIKPAHLINFFENIINPPSFEKIVLVCNSGDISALCAMAMKYLGYHNVYPLRNGLSSWSEDIAKKFQLKEYSSFLIKKLDTNTYPKNLQTDYPVLLSYENNVYKNLRNRIMDVLNSNLEEYYITINELLDNSDNYYKISYWPTERYNKGHIKGEIQYTPKSSLKSSEYLNTLPTNQPIVINCYAGNHSNFVVMYLRLLGYNALVLKYGANSFMHEIIKNEERASRYFKQSDIYNFPMVNNKKSQTIIEPKEIKTITPSGGC